MTASRGLFETFALEQGFSTRRDEQGKYLSPNLQYMWETWEHQRELMEQHLLTITVLESRISGLLKQCHEHDTRRSSAVTQAASLASEVERLTELLESPMPITSPRMDNMHLLHRYIIILGLANDGPVTTTGVHAHFQEIGFKGSRALAQRALSDMYALGILERITNRDNGKLSVTYHLSKRTPLIAIRRET